MLQPFDDTYFMKKALQEAQEAYRQGEIPVGAVVVAGGTIIARAHNLTETLTDDTAHAARLYALRYLRTLSNVWWGIVLESDISNCLWGSRYGARLHQPKYQVASQD